MIGGGEDEHTVEVFIPDTGKTCSLSSLPDKRHTATLDTLDNTPVICGGGPGNNQNECLQFTPTSPSGVWTNYADLMELRTGHVSWASSRGLMLMGGNTYGGTTTEMVPSHDVRFGLVQKTGCACSIAERDHVIITGGKIGYFVTKTVFNTVSKYNLYGHLENLPEMNQGRYYHGCGSYYSDGQKVLLVAGGIAMNQELLSSTEKMNIGATAWTTIKPLPRTLFGVATVSMDNKVFLTGGTVRDTYDENSMRAEVLAFDGEDWNKVGQLKKARKHHAATKIDIDIDCN